MAEKKVKKNENKSCVSPIICYTTFKKVKKEITTMQLLDSHALTLLQAQAITLGEYNAWIDKLQADFDKACAEFDKALAEGTEVALIGAC